MITNKVLVDQGHKIYSRSMKSWLHDKIKSVAAATFARNLNSNIYSHMTAASKNAYNDNIYKVIDKYRKRVKEQ